MTVDFIYFDAGGGHRAAANALRQVMEQQGRPFEVRLVNLQEVLDEMDVFRKVTGLRLQDIYNLMLKKGWTLGSPQLMVGMHWVIRLFHGKTVRLLEKFWGQRVPGMVVSLVPNLDRALWRQPGARPPRRTVCHHPDGYCGLPAALLDGAASATFHLRIGKSGGAGAGDGTRRRQDPSRLRHA